MVTSTSPQQRRAFTLIELIFAIVIIGLVVVTIPTILISNARHVERSLLQEAVLMATAKMGQNMGFRPKPLTWQAATACLTVLPLTTFTATAISTVRISGAATSSNPCIGA